ncbi:hypothetical protein [Paenibacillus xylanilyticus]|uniref:hypothetical protein n=1 Tax=Paenibacillus xylanilyticus TaxID=248903 RepID=UPI003AAA412E
MKKNTFAKVLLLSSALLLAATPAYAASGRPVSNTITASFKVNPVAPSFMLKWVDNDNRELETLPLQTVTSGESKDVTVRATVSQNYSDISMVFTITRTDGTAITEGDVELNEYVENVLGTPRTGYLDDEGRLVIRSKYYRTISSPGKDFFYNLKFNTTGEYQISVVAVNEPA